MMLTRKLAFLVACWLASFQLCIGALPPTAAIGKLLGYPSSELIIEDNTEQEQTVIQTPSRRDSRKHTILPDAASLLKAYLIHGKDENTFFPIQIYIGKKNTFLTAEVLDLLAKNDAMPATQRVTREKDFISIGKGGGYITQYFKVKSDSPPIDIPNSAVAMVTVLQPHGQDVDVQIAQRLDQDLKPILGGETYYNAFGPSSDEKTEPRLDIPKLYVELSNLVIAGWLAEKGANDTVLSAQPIPSPSAWLWWVGVLTLMLLVFAANKYRKHRR